LASYKRFIGADSVVPGNASGSLQGMALKPLTVDIVARFLDA
jgi:hypothetical protein